MKFVSGLYTDIGIKKSTNQDSMLLLHAMIDNCEVVFAVICDGMGGLQKGEVASADVIHAFHQWFKERFPAICPGGRLDVNQLQQDWSDLIDARCDAISKYGSVNGFSLGTTLTCLLIVGNQYYIANIGDSRVYLFNNQVMLLTHDQTLVQQKIDEGLLTYEQAENDPQRSVLLQCIGASDFVNPDFYTGPVESNAVFMLCSDGFRHLVSTDELYSYLNATRLVDQTSIEANLRDITELLKMRRETDNISAIAIRTF